MMFTYTFFVLCCSFDSENRRDKFIGSLFFRVDVIEPKTSIRQTIFVQQSGKLGSDKDQVKHSGVQLSQVWNIEADVRTIAQVLWDACPTLEACRLSKFIPNVVA